MSNIEQAIALAVKAHQGQVDKIGRPYILHPLRVMFQLTGDEAQIVGILHDVVEDSAFSLKDLAAMGYSRQIVGAVDDLTRRGDESYEEFIDRLAPNPLARQVKLADLEDNMDLRRLEALGDHDVERLRRYHRAYERLIEQ